MLNNRLDEKVIGTAAVTVDILPKGYGIPNTKITPTSITIHNTDNWDSTAKNNHSYMKNINKSGDRKASWHFTVDDIEIYQAQSTNYKCLHAGNTEGNNTSIGIEICQFRDQDKQLKAYKNAIALVKILIAYHNLSIDKVVQHNKWSGKNCPSVLRTGTYSYDWNWFINNIKIENKKDGWYQFGDKWSYLENEKWICEQWKFINNKWYYFDIEGYSSFGWKQIENKWYYFDGNCQMQTGWINVDGKDYYLHGNGEMETDHVDIGSRCYHFEESGELIKTSDL